jgi:hypothetical protein
MANMQRRNVAAMAVAGRWANSAAGRPSGSPVDGIGQRVAFMRRAVPAILAATSAETDPELLTIAGAWVDSMMPDTSPGQGDGLNARVQQLQAALQALEGLPETPRRRGAPPAERHPFG